MLSHCSLLLLLGCVSISEPASLRHQHYSDGSSNAGKITVSLSEGLKSEESKVLLVSSSRSERTETRVSSSANASRYYDQLSSFWSDFRALVPGIDSSIIFIEATFLLLHYPRFPLYVTDCGAWPLMQATSTASEKPRGKPVIACCTFICLTIPLSI